MPELPEVETIARALRPELIGLYIVSGEILWKKTLMTPGSEEFNLQIPGQQILDVTRRAKFLQLKLTNYQLFIHLRMSGDLLIKNGTAVEKHDRLILHLSDGRKLVFNDTRKFGRIWLTAQPDDVLGKLGPEPFDLDLTPQVFFTRLHERHRQIKPLLLDQSFLAGLGNIYADEANHLAGVHPLQISDTISPIEAEKLFNAIRTVLQTGIEHNGASIDWVYRGGDFQNYFRVYGRENMPCLICGSQIQKIQVGQRGTHFCPHCQEIHL